MAVVGVGVDVVDVARFHAMLERRPRIVCRLFSEAEAADGARMRDPSAGLAARFAAKEAVMKALGVGLGAFALRDVEVVRADSGAPGLVLSDRAAGLAAARGVTSWHLSLSHSDLTAIAIAVAESTD